jgi:hypothetical protein
VRGSRFTFVMPVGQMTEDESDEGRKMMFSLL